MTTEAPTRIDMHQLLHEARRYLAAVDTFRAEGHEPSWRAECEPAPRKKRNGRAVHVQ
jgi:hypothetical protein